jgi:hypothetical protein
MRAEEWLADRTAALLNRAIERMPAARQEWGRAIAAELAAVPAGRERLRWSVSGLWYAVRHGRSGAAAVSREVRVVTWLRRAFALAGAVLVAPWLLVSVLQLTETDAPDIAWEYSLLMAVCQLIVVIAFLANWWAARASRVAVLVSILVYAIATGVAAQDFGQPLLAALVFGVPPLLAAIPILLLARALPEPAPTE